MATYQDFNVTPHFKISEFYNTKHEKFFVPNRASFFLNPIFIARAVKIAMRLEIIRALFGKCIRITSGYRNTDLNTAVHGAKYSEHLTMCAVDIAPLDIDDMLDLVHAVKEYQDIEPFEIRYKEIHSNYIHLSFDNLQFYG